ncbi:MAG: SDR family NAD(P)-dependent oxidoreductase [Candidatus Binatus sp.]
MSNNILDLKGRVGLVTGAGQGVGRAVALRFAENNAGGVVINDFRLERAEAVAAEVEKLGVKAIAAQCDVTNFASVTAMFEKARAAFGKVDILVNNAGNAGADPSAVARKPFWEQEPKDWEPFLGTNLFGVLNCVRIAGPEMIANKYGKIVTVISDAGRVGEPHLEIYSGPRRAPRVSCERSRRISVVRELPPTASHWVRLGPLQSSAPPRTRRPSSGCLRSTRSSASASRKMRPT